MPANAVPLEELFATKAQKAPVVLLHPIIRRTKKTPPEATHRDDEGFFYKIRADGKTFIWRDDWYFVRIRLDTQERPKQKVLSVDLAKLRATRLRRGYRRERLASVLGCSAATVSSIERGSCTNEKFLRRYCRWASQRHQPKRVNKGG